MKTRTIFAALPLIAGLVLSSCGVAPAAAPNPLPGTSWVLTTLNGAPVGIGTPITLNLEEAKLSGTDGCNNYGGSYTVNGAKFTVDKNLISTMMACPDTIMQRAGAYITALTQAAAFKIDGQQLTLSDAAGKALATFTRQSSELGGSSWLVTGYNNGKQAVVSLALGTTLTADFGADGRLGGSAGCNSYTATFEVAGKSLKIGPVASTRKFCAEPAGVMEQETQYLKALETAATYRIDADKLELRTADGALAASLARAPRAVTSPTGAPQPAASIGGLLANVEYMVEGTSTGKAQLKDGVFEEAAAPGSAAKTRVELGKTPVFGDVNGDGAEDAAVTLIVIPGGSGSFTHLAVVVNDKGAPKPSPAVLLGDRIIVKSVTIKPGAVTVTLLIRKPEEAMSAAPTVEVTRVFAWQGGALVPLK
jgi:heat shock protein HslJ